MFAQQISNKLLFGLGGIVSLTATAAGSGLLVEGAATVRLGDNARGRVEAICETILAFCVASSRSRITASKAGFA